MISFDWFDKWAGYHPFKIAFRDFESEREYSYSQFNKLGNNFAGILHNDYGFNKGDRLAVIAENNLEYIVLFALAQKLGIVLVPLNFRLTSHELEFVIGDAEVKGIIYDEKFLPKIENLKSYREIDFKMAMEKFHELNLICLANKISPSKPISLINQDDPIFILYTSGTTAFPKGALYTHKMLFWNSINTELRLDLTSSDISLNCAPPFHTGGWNVLLAPFIHHGAYTLIMRSFDADLVLEMLEFERATIWWAVPTMLKMMAESPVFDKVELSRLRYLIVGGEAMPIPLIEKWHKKGVLIRQGYGLTEVGPNITSLNHTDAIRKKGSIGTLNFYYEAKLVNQKFEEVAADEIGEMVLKGPTVTPGYWKNDAATRETIQDGWFHTGDLMRKDDEGYYYVVDRIKNMYISGGENVYPAEVEHIISTHTSVAEVAIVGVSDEKWGEAGIAFVSLRPGFTTSEEELRAFCMGRLAKYKIPKKFRFIGQLPKNDAGKIDRKVLKTMH